MKAILNTVQKIRSLVNKEYGYLPEEVSLELDNLLSILEGDLNREIGELNAQSHTEAPNPYEDDGDEYLKKRWY